MADVAAEDDVIEREERELIESIIEFGDTVVREVMVPRPDMVTVAGDFRGRRRDGGRASLNGYSRMPVSARASTTSSASSTPRTSCGPSATARATRRSAELAAPGPRSCPRPSGWPS